MCRPQSRRRQGDVGAGDRADLDPVERAAPVAADREQGGDRRLRGGAPQIVEDDVDLGCRRGQRLGAVVERDGEVGVEYLQTFATAPGGDDGTGPEQPCDAHGHGSGVAGGAEHEHGGARGEGHPSSERHPRRHRGVHRGGDAIDVDVGRQRDDAARVHDGLRRQRAVLVVVGREVHEPTVVSAPDPVDPRHEGEPTGAGVVGASRAGTYAGMDADRQDVDHLLALAGFGEFEGKVAGGFVERLDDGGVDLDHGSTPFSWRHEQCST